MQKISSCVGFGKKIIFPTDIDKSISLNWRCDVPDEFSQREYRKETEVYFVGKLFEYLLQQNQIENFLYHSELQLMTKRNPQNRLKSFSSLQNNLSQKSKLLDFFSDEEKEAYRNFADAITKIITKVENKSTYNNDAESILWQLESVYQKNMAETTVQNIVSIIRVFVKGSFYYKKDYEMYVWCLEEFIDFLKSCSKEKFKIITMNIYNRLDGIQRYKEDDIPF
jgi:serine/threonine-protein kinase